MAKSNILAVGDLFHTFDDFQERLHQFETEQRYKLSKKNSKRLPLDYEKLKFYEANYWCPLGGKFVSKGTGVREIGSKKIDCPAKLQIRVDKDRNYLRILQLECTHNHPPLEENNLAVKEINRDKRISLAEDRKSLLQPVVEEITALLIDAPAETAFNEGLRAVTLLLQDLRYKFETTRAEHQDSSGVPKKVLDQRSRSPSILSIDAAAKDNVSPDLRSTENYEDELPKCFGLAAIAHEYLDVSDSCRSSTLEIVESETDDWVGTASALCRTSYGVSNVVEKPVRPKASSKTTEYDEIDEEVLIEAVQSIEKRQIHSHASPSTGKLDMSFLIAKDQESASSKEYVSAAVSHHDFKVDDGFVVDSVVLECSTSIATKSKNALSSIVMPKKESTKGRPKGAVLTAIGCHRKEDTSKAFCEKHDQRKVVEILSWLVEDWMIELVMNGEYRIKKKDLKLEKLRDSLVDENVNVNLVAPFFESNAFSALQKALDKKKKNGTLSCAICRENISIESVLCDRCLLWHHYRCVGLRRSPRAAKWFCPKCKKST